jgi:hypothetical protein
MSDILSKKKVIIYFIYLIILSDMLTCFAANIGFGFTNFSLLIKSPIELFFLYQLYKDKRTNKYFILILVLLINWGIGVSVAWLINNGTVSYNASTIFVDNAESNRPYLTSFIVFNRCILLFCILPVLLIYKNDLTFITNCKKVFERFLYFNSALIVIGAIFKIPLFASYNLKELVEMGYDLRFGYKGLIFGINEVTGVYFLGLAYAFREVFVNEDKTKVYLLLIVIIGALLTGSKGSILAFVILTAYYMARYKFRFFLLLIFPTIIFGIYYLVTNDIFELITTKLNVSFAENGAGTDTPLDALLTLLTSNRNIYISYNWQYMLRNWSVLNWIFGDGVLGSETDLVDLYYLFGFGSVIYLYFYKKMFFAAGKNKNTKYIFAFLLLLAFTGGHFIRSAVVPIFLGLYIITGSKEKTIIENS